MRLIYLMGGNVAKSKFDMSLLEPVDEQNADFESQLKPLDENEEDEGAYLDNLPKPEGTHPFKDIFIGLTHAGRNLHNLPHDLVKGFEKGTEGFGKLFDTLPGPKLEKGKPLSDYLPYDTNNYSDVFGQKDEGTLLDKLIQKGVEHAPELIGAGGLIRGGFRRLKGTHQLDFVDKAMKERGLNFSYPQEMINESKKFLPNTIETKEMIDAVKGGTYKPGFKMQSQVGHHQRQLAKSPLASENSIMAPKAGELKQQMIGHLEKVMRNNGLNREADLLKTGINNYRVYTQIKNAALPVLKKAGIPVTILAALDYGFKKVKKLLND